MVRNGLRGVLPEGIRHRHDKVGFPAPEEAWIRRNAKLVRAELSAVTDRFPQVLCPALLDGFERMVGAEAAAYDGLFFRAVALNRWAQVFVESGAELHMAKEQAARAERA